MSFAQLAALALLALHMCSSCASPLADAFASAQIDPALPSEIRARAVLNDGGANVYEPTRILGNIYRVQANHGGQVFLPNDYIGKLAGVQPKQLTITTPLRHQGKLTSKSSVAAAYLTFAADIKSNQIADIIMSDVSSHAMNVEPSNDEIIKALDAISALRNSDTVIIVTAVTLSSIAYKIYQSTTQTVGLQGAFGFDAQVYASNELFSLDYVLGLNYIVATKSVSPGATTPITLYDIRRVTTPIDVSEESLKRDEDRWLHLIDKQK